MPTRDQVRVHYELEAQRRAQEYQLQQAGQAQAAQQQYQISSALQAQGAQQQAALATHHTDLQSQLQAQGAQQQAALASHQTDLQARLHEVTLNQQEQNRLQRMYAARASIEDNADLAPAERRMLITQLESGINPLENRQREQQIIQGHLQSVALNQRTQQEGILFGQQQAWLARGVTGNLQTITDPITGQPGLFHVGPDGKIQQLDFGHQAEMHQARMQAMQAQTQATQQNTEQQQQLFPGQVESQALHNRQLSDLIAHSRQANPLDIEHRRLANQQIATLLEQSPQRFNMDMLRGYYDIAGLHQALDERLRAQPNNLNLLEARARTAQMDAGTGPFAGSPGLHEQAQRARVAFERAQADHMGQLVANMPSVAEAGRRRGAEDEHLKLTNQALSDQLTRFRNLGVDDHTLATIGNHAFQYTEQEIQHAESELDRLLRLPSATDADRQQARDALDRLRRNQPTAIRNATTTMVNLHRAMRGLPALPGGQEANPQPNPQPFHFDRPETQNPQQRAAVAGFTQMHQDIGRLPAGQQTQARSLLMQLQTTLSNFGSRAAMPAAVRDRYDAMGRQLHQILNAPRPRGAGGAVINPSGDPWGGVGMSS